MINKTSIFASAGTTAGSSSSGYTTGMVPNTIAKAEDVNLYMGISDQQLYSVCKEVANLLTGFGITLNSNSYTQLQNWAKGYVTAYSYLTGVTSAATTPTQSGNSISFPATTVVYNTGVYYGNTLNNQQKTTLAATNLAANSNWANGVHFIYAKTTSGSTTSTLDHQQDPIDPSESATKCMLGSVFVINGAFQANSWKYQPWLQITSVERRESPTAMTKGGFISPASSTTLQMGALEIMDEGLNFGTNHNKPNIMTVQEKSPFPYKFLYPGYNPSSSEVTTLDTTHVYNTTGATWDTLTVGTAPKYMVMVPCIVPTGQTLMIPAMSPKVGSNYTQIYDSMEDAINAIYGLQYSLSNVAKRAIYLGQSIVVRVGATDLTDPLQCITVGMLPQALGGFTTASGQAGGGITTYRPMPSYTYSGVTSVTAQNNAANLIIGANSAITVTLPTPEQAIVNQLEVQFSKGGSGDITWGTSITWYTGVAPTFSQGRTYNIILEYINGTWYGGVLGVGA